MAALAGLTGRGRALVAVGLGVLAAAVVFGQRDLLRVGVLVLVLPLLSVALLARTRYRLACARSVIPARVPVGGEASATLVLENVSRLPSGLLLARDTLPWQLGVAPRLVIDRLEADGRREVSYPLQAQIRGRYPVGPLTVRLVDPFGLCSLTRAFQATDQLLVTPVVYALPSVPLGGDWSGQGDSRTRTVASSGEDDVVPRGYRTGDELRRVHWKATARAGELMVRREELPWRSRATLVVDTRAMAHRQRPIADHARSPGASIEPVLSASSYEWTLSAVASIGVHLLRHGWSLRLMDGDAHPLTAETDHAGADLEGLLLDALAVATPTPGETLGASAPQQRRRVADGLVIAVVGRTDPTQAQELAGIRPGASTAIAIIVDVDAWSTPVRGSHVDAPGTGAAARSAAVLRAAGWRVAIAHPDEPLATLWGRLASGLQTADRMSEPGTAGRSPYVRPVDHHRQDVTPAAPAAGLPATTPGGPR